MLEERIFSVAPDPRVRFELSVRATARAEYDIGVASVASEQDREDSRPTQTRVMPYPGRADQKPVDVVRDAARRNRIAFSARGSLQPAKYG